MTVRTVRRQGGALLCALILSAAPVTGGGTRFHEVSDFRGVAGLELQGVAVTRLGGLARGPQPRALAGPSLPVIWDLLPAPDGTLHAAGGAPGTLLRFPPAAEGQPLLVVAEAEVTALATGPQGRILAAISPGGRVESVAPDGTATTLLATGSRYIWDLLDDGQGGLWVATGDPGGVLHMPAPGEPARQVVLLGHDQARCLAPAGAGAVWVGTSGRGRIVKVDGGGLAGVLLESEHAEVAALVVVEGDVVAALVSAAGGTPSAPPLAPGGSPASGAQAPAGPGLPQAAGGAAAGRGGEAAGRSEVVRIDASGGVNRLWAGQGEIAVSLLHRPGSGEIWVGTSPGGAIHAIDLATGQTRRLATLPARSVTALAAEPGGAVIAATGGLGSVVRLAPPAAGDEGLVVAPVHDAGPGARFGAARWEARGSGAPVELSFRSGVSARPDETWSAWSDWRRGGEAAAPVAPPGRFVQWRARFRSGAVELARVRLAILPQNRPPRLERTEVLPSGVALEPLPAVPGPAAPAPGSAAAGALGGDGGGGIGPGFRVRRVFQAGRRTVTWDAADDDGDPLVARLLLRGDADDAFLLFAEGITDGFHVFDEARLPDGGYVFRVEVSDAPGNTKERARQAFLETARFVVDRTPPVIEDLRWQASRGDWVFSFVARDAGEGVRGASWSLNGGPWQGALPDDGVEDQPRERYRITAPAGGAGTHEVVITVRDLAGNEASARLRFTPQP